MSEKSRGGTVTPSSPTGRDKKESVHDEVDLEILGATVSQSECLS